MLSASLLIGVSNQIAWSKPKHASEAGIRSTSFLVARANPATTTEADIDSDDDETDAADLKSSSSSNSSPSQSKTQNKPQQFKRQLIDTSIEEAPAAPTAPSASEQKSPAYLEREAKLSEPLKKLIQAPQIYDNSKGGSSEFSDAFVAASKDGAKSREDLLFIVENGSPAGRIYAAVLIKNFDAPMGNKILNGFKTEKTLVNNKSYTSLEHFTMGEVVTDLLSPAPTIILKPR